MRAPSSDRRTRAARQLLAGALALLLAVAAAAPSLASPTDRATSAQPAALELVTQTPTVAPGGTFDLAVRPTGLPGDAYLDVVIRGRVRSRSELAASMNGDGLRSQVYAASPLLTSLPTDAQGARHLLVSLDPAVAGGVPISSPGAYPVQVSAQDVAGTELASFVTHLIVRPGPTDESPPLAVSVVAELDAPAALQPDGSTRLGADVVTGLQGLTTALAETTGVPATLAARPETLDALAAAGASQPAAAELLDLLPRAAAGRSALSLPFADVTPDDLVTANLPDELARQTERGAATIEGALGVTPVGTSWLADDGLGERGLRSLRALGVRHLVVGADAVEPLRPGVLSLSLAQPFLVPSTGDEEVDALALDPELLARLESEGAPGLTVSRVLAELAVLWFEQPGIARGAVLPVDEGTDPAVVRGLLSGLSTSGILRPVSLDDAFAAAAPLRQPGGGGVSRALVDRSSTASISRDVAFSLGTQRARLASLAGLLGGSPVISGLEAHLLVAVARDLRPSERSAHVETVGAAIDGVVGGVTTQARETITLTARDGTVPITLHNDTGAPVVVVVHARSTKLEFPEGDAIELTLSEPITRLDLAVRARTSGSVKLDLSVTSPDGLLVLDDHKLTVQSTAISGAGALLSAGAAVFLLVWWARHWRRTRRSAKLVDASHPALHDAQ